MKRPCVWMKLRTPRSVVSIIALSAIANPVLAFPPTYTDFNLVFADEFNAPLNTNHWEILTDDGSWLLSSRGPDNIEVSDGTLILKTLSNPPEQSHDWSTGHLRTRWTQKYGYFEARFKYANHPWLNNAFWLFGSGVVGSVGNQLEIDMNEGRAPNEITQNYHIHPDRSGSTRLYPANDLTESWHTYGAEWTPRHITYYFDGEPTHTVYLNTSSYYPRDVRFSTAILQWLVDRTPDETRDPAGYHMEIDSVKIWQRHDSYTNSGLYTTAGQSGMIQYIDAIEAPSDGSAAPLLWYKTSRTPNFGTGESLHTLTSSGAITNMTTDYWRNPNSAFGLAAGSNPAAIAGSTGLFASGTNGAVSFMFKTPKTLSGFKSLFNQGYYGSVSQFEMGINGSTLRLGTQNGATQPTQNIGILTANTWYYFAMAWNLSEPSDNLTWHYGIAGDATLNEGTATITSAGATNQAIYIGGRKNTDYYTLAGGYFQNVAIYGQTLSSEAIQNQFSAISEPLSSGYTGFAEFYEIDQQPNAGPEDDYDGDGQPNVYEYGLGGDPRNPADTGTKPSLHFDTDTNVSFQNVILSDPDADITYSIEQTSNLINSSWTNDGWSQITTNTTGDERFDQLEHHIDGSTNDHRYFRLRITPIP